MFQNIIPKIRKDNFRNNQYNIGSNLFSKPLTKSVELSDTDLTAVVGGVNRDVCDYPYPIETDTCPQWPGNPPA